MFRPSSKQRWIPALSLVLSSIGGACGKSEPPRQTPEEAWNEQRPAAELGAQSSQQFEELVASGTPDPVGAIRRNLESNPTVTDVTYLDVSGTMVAQASSGVPFNLLLADATRKEWTPVPQPTAAALKLEAVSPVTATSIRCEPKSFPQSKKACIVRAFNHEFHQDLNYILERLRLSGFEVTNFALRTPDDVKNLRSALPSCGLLYIGSHGTVEKSIARNAGNHVMTEIELGSGPAGRMLDALAGSPAPARNLLGIVGHRGKSFYSLAPEFFDSIKYPNTMVYVDACSGAEAVSPTLAPGGTVTQLRQVFRKNGAGAFLSWQSAVSNQLAVDVTDQIFEKLTPNVTNIERIDVIAPPTVPLVLPYTVRANVVPPQAGVSLHLTVSGTDEYDFDDDQVTDAAGSVTFEPVEGSAVAETRDTITVSVGGASNAATAAEVVKNNPTLQNYRLAWVKGDAGAAKLELDANDDFNLVCVNQRLTKTEIVVKFPKPME